MTKYKVLILGPTGRVSGPIPLLVRLLVDALVATGYEVDLQQWGRRTDQESLPARLWGPVRNAISARSALKRKRYDLMVVESSHDWRSLIRDIALLAATRHAAPRIIVQSHGSNAGLMSKGGNAIFKAATRLRFSMTDADIYSSTEEVRAFAAFAPTHAFYVADNIYPQAPEDEAAADLSRFSIPPERRCILFAARLIPDKGILDLLDAMPLLLARIDCHLLIAGAGPLEAMVRSRLMHEPLASRTTLLGYLTRAELRSAMRRSAVFVLPTYHAEGFPQTVQEAMGQGLPIVTVATRGLADHLIDGVHGRLIRAHDVDALAGAIVDVLNNQSNGGDMSHNCIAKSAVFSSEVVIPQYERIFNAVIAHHAS